MNPQCLKKVWTNLHFSFNSAFARCPKITSCSSHELPRTTLNVTIEFEAAKAQIVWTAWIFSDLYDTEEAEALVAKLMVDLLVDAEVHGSACPREVLKICLKSCVTIMLVRMINSCIYDVELSTRGRGFEVPVAQDMACHISVA